MQKIYLWIFFLTVFICGCSTQMLVKERPLSSVNQDYNYKYRIYESAGEKTEKELVTNSVDFKIQGEVERCLINWIYLCPNTSNVLAEVAGYDYLGQIETVELSYYDFDKQKEIWRITLDEGGGISVEDIAFVGDRYVVLKNQQRELICIGLDDGKEKWRVDESTINYMRYLEDSNKLLTYDSSGELSLYNPVSGDTIWVSQVGYDYPGEPIVKGDNIYFVMDGLNKFDVNEGFKWKSEIITDYTESNVMVDVLSDVVSLLLFGQPSYSSSAPDSYYGCFTTPQIEGDTLLFSSLGAIYMIDDLDGEVLWQTEPLEKFIITNQLKHSGDILYLKSGGHTFFFNGVDRSRYYTTRGKQGVAAYNIKNNSLDWVTTTDTLLTGESSALNDFLFRDDDFFMVTATEVSKLKRVDGSIVAEISSEDLRIGELFKAGFCKYGLLIKGSEGISLIDINTFDPVWSRNVKSFPLAMRPLETGLTLWMTNSSYDSYCKAFFEGYFHLVPEKDVVLMSSTIPRSIIGINIKDGSIRCELPVLSDKSVLDFNNGIVFDIKNNKCCLIDFEKLLNSL